MPASPEPTARGERALIERLRQLLAPPESELHATADDDTVGFGDDMALLTSASPGPLLWTVDTLMDGVDFRSGSHPWDAIGRKALAVNLSDCAAMAARPVGALCSLVLQNSLTMDDAVALVRGAAELGRRYNCPVVGGDTNSWDAPTVISFTVAARVLPDVPSVRRIGARAGDRLYVSGRLGGSILGRHLTFEPRVALALDLARRLQPHAMIDISDGLALDLDRVLQASRCGAVLDETLLQAVIHPDAEQLAAQSGQPALEHALHDGEDFELLIALPADVDTATCATLGLLPIGTCTGARGMYLRNAAGEQRPLDPRGWEHFR